jgi:hypothetical protein
LIPAQSSERKMVPSPFSPLLFWLWTLHFTSDPFHFHGSGDGSCFHLMVDILDLFIPQAWANSEVEIFNRYKLTQHSYLNAFKTFLFAILDPFFFCCSSITLLSYL